MANRFSRRRFVLGSASMALLFPTLNSCTSITSAEKQICDELNKIFIPESAQMLGAWYLKQGSQTLTLREALSDLSLLSSDSDIFAHIEKNIARDYRALSIVHYEGWMVSQTEARLSAALVLYWREGN